MDVRSCVNYYKERFVLGDTEGWGDAAAVAAAVLEAKEGIYRTLTAGGIKAFEGTR